MKEFFIKLLNETFTKYIPMLTKDKLTLEEVKVLTEYSLLLLDLIRKLDFESYEKALIERLFNKFNDMLYTGERIFFFSSFYYLPNNINKIEDLSKATYKVNIDINLMRLLILSGGIMGSSEDEYFFSRGQNDLLRAMRNLVNKGTVQNELYIPAFYTLLNYHQAIMEYLESDNKLYFNQAQHIIVETNKIINEFTKKKIIKDRLESDYQVRFFLENEVKRYKVWNNEDYEINRIDVKGFRNYKNVSKKNWAYLNFSFLDTDSFKSDFINDFNLMFGLHSSKLKPIEQIILLRNCASYLELEQDTYVKLNIPVFEKLNEKYWFQLSNYFNGYDKINDIHITEDNRKEVEIWDDNELRSRVGKTIINIDRSLIARESVKPHGVFEIADMELPIRLKDTFYTYYLCMPFKSGREINGKVKEDITYQVFRPFTYFGDKAIVVFISVKEATEPFYNAVKRAKANLNWEVHTLIGDSLIKLLKYNNQI